MSEILHVGYGTSEAWLRNRPVNERVNVCARVTEKSTEYGIGTTTVHLVLSYHEAGSDEVDYLQVRIDAFKTHGGDLLGAPQDSFERHEKRRRSALTAAEAWLAACGIPYREALIDVPEGHTQIEGHASWLVFDPETSTFSVGTSPCREAIT